MQLTVELSCNRSHVKIDVTNGDGRGGAVVVSVGPDQHQALQHAERKVSTYGKALLSLASLLCLSLCGNLASSALSILVFKESRFRGAIPPQRPPVVLSDSKAAAPVGTSLPTYVKDTPAVQCRGCNNGVRLSDYGFECMSCPRVDSLASVPGMKKCAIASSGTEACWELADPAMTDIPDDLLNYNTYLYLDIAIDDITASAFAWTKLAGTLKVGPAVKTIGTSAFARTKFTCLDLSEATSLVEIGESAFYATDLAGTLVIPSTVTTIGSYAFQATKLTGVDLSKATALVSIANSAFLGTELAGTLMNQRKVTTVGSLKVLPLNGKPKTSDRPRRVAFRRLRTFHKHTAYPDLVRDLP
eukprot:scaffold33070_cov61-Phaeocystis_antarctica.AAC.2